MGTAKKHMQVVTCMSTAGYNALMVDIVVYSRLATWNRLMPMGYLDMSYKVGYGLKLEL